MKKNILMIIITLSLAFPAWAEEIQPQITAYGTAIIEVTPDEMSWALNVTNRGAGIEEIAEQHSQIVLFVLSFLKTTGVANDDTQTSMMQFGENWENENGHRILKGYFASSQVSFKLTDFSKYQSLWLGLSKIEGLSIQNIAYDYSKRIEAQNQARIDALLVAKEKIESMAKTLNVGLGNPLLIEDNQSFNEPMRSNMLMAKASFQSESSDAGGFALGKIEIKSNVRVVYALDYK